MKNVFDELFFDNPLSAYLWSAGIILLIILLNRFLSRCIAWVFCRLFRRGWKSFDQKQFTDLIVHPLGVFLVVTVCIATLYRLNFPSSLNIIVYKYPLQRVFLSIAILIQIISFTWLMLRIIDFIAGLLAAKASGMHAQSSQQLVVFFRDFLKVITGIIGLMLILHFAFDYDISNLLTGLSIVGAAIALALKESLENLIASFVIFFDKPFTAGDTVKVQNITGMVERIGLRSTRIRSDQKTYVTVPNKQMVDTILDNISLRTQQRNELQLQLELTTPSEKIDQLVKELNGFLGGLSEIAGFNVYFFDITAQAYVIMIEYFVAAPYLSKFNQLKQNVNSFALKQMEKLEVKPAGRKRE